MFYLSSLAVAAVLAGAKGTAPIENLGPRRVIEPLVPWRLRPLTWGTVQPRGWIRDWAVAGRNGAVSPKHAAFANVQDGKVNGWRDGRPDSTGFWDEGLFVCLRAHFYANYLLTTVPNELLVIFYHIRSDHQRSCQDSAYWYVSLPWPRFN